MDEIPYTVRRSERARRARIDVRPAGVEVVVPRRMALRHVSPFVEEKRPWIERTLRRYRDAERATPRARLEDGGSVPFLGEELELRVSVERDRVRAAVKRCGHRLHVRLPLPGPGPLRAALEAWYRRRARAEIAALLEAATARAGTRYARLSIRGQRTRWASCSPAGAMSFNWRLLLAPAAILDYVVEHEVAHLEIPDHSPGFWRLLSERCPDCREHERWLRRHGSALRL